MRDGFGNAANEDVVTPIATALLAAALSLPSPHGSTEPADAYRDRIETIAHAIAVESRGQLGVAMAALVTFYYESGFRADVHSGETLGDAGRAICAGQHHRNGRTEAAWRALAGTSLDATRRCARATIDAIRGAHGYCSRGRGNLDEPALSRALALYGRGNGCEPTRGSRRRAAKWTRLLAVARAGATTTTPLAPTPPSPSALAKAP